MDQFIIKNEILEDANYIENLYAKIFGPARFTKAVHLIREKIAHNLNHSFAMHTETKLIGSLRLTPIVINDVKAFLLGPLAIDSNYQNLGLGSKMMHRCLEHMAKQKIEEKLILLVGDVAYYSKFGFKQINNPHISLPAPVDRNRILIFELCHNISSQLQGMVRPGKC